MSGLRVMQIHPADGEWRAYHDGEVSAVRHAALAAHLGRCPRCQARLAAMEANAHFAAARLRALQVAAGAPLPPEVPESYRKERYPVRRIVKPLTVAVAALLFLLIPLAVSPGLRARAAELLHLIQPRQIQVLSMSEADRARLERAPTGVAKQLAELLFPPYDQQEEREPPSEQIKVEEMGPRGFAVPGYIPPGYAVQWLGQHTRAWEISHRLNVPEINRLLGEAGVDYRLPAELDGADLRFHLGEIFLYTLRPQAGGEAVVIIQEGPRAFAAAEGADLRQLLGALLVRSALDAGASPEVVERLGQNRTLHTVQVPIVPDRDSEVEVNGVTGAFMVRGGKEHELVWMQNGTTWRILGTLSKEEMLKIARSMAE